MKKKSTVKMFHGAPSRLFEFSRKNREKATPAEALLWDLLKNKQLDGYKFRRQHPIQFFILDFYCHSKKLAVEVDGGYHNDPVQIKYDIFRTAAIQQLGIRVIRFTNQQVLQHQQVVLDRIMEILTEEPRL